VLTRYREKILGINISGVGDWKDKGRIIGLLQARFPTNGKLQLTILIVY
jgi:hypothetical protein